jgi:hypothetical protein
MKLLALISTSLFIIGISACNSTNKKSINNLPKPDTISVSFSSWNFKNESPSNHYERILIKEYLSDSTIRYKYIHPLRNEYSYNYEFIFNDNDLKLQKAYSLKSDSSEYEEDKMVVVDTFEFFLFDKKIKAFKYELENPPIDGESCEIFNIVYGQIARGSYSWITKTILASWEGRITESELKTQIIGDSIKILKRKYPISPPPLPKMKYYDSLIDEPDTVEIEIEINKNNSLQ